MYLHQIWRKGHGGGAWERPLFRFGGVMLWMSGTAANGKEKTSDVSASRREGKEMSV
uniref:Uncharacterized protein n=1 Tax=Arundo donax TaxID=35708 RepID=A0A0A8ZIL3_ARUDO